MHKENVIKEIWHTRRNTTKKWSCKGDEPACASNSRTD